MAKAFEGSNPSPRTNFLYYAVLVSRPMHLGHFDMFPRKG